VLRLIGAFALTFAWPPGPRRGKITLVPHLYYQYRRYYRRRRRYSPTRVIDVMPDAVHCLLLRPARFFYDRTGGAAMAVFYAVMVEVDPEE
jgi:hypothetical protein